MPIITVVDNGTGTTEFLLGEKSGTAGINGCTIMVEDITQTPLFDLIATDADITDFGVYGTTFLGADATNLPADSTLTEVLNTNFNACGQIDPSTCTMLNCNFVASAATGTGAVLLDSTTYNITYCNFIACTYGIQITTTGTFDSVTGLVFTNSGTADLNNTSGGSVTWNNDTPTGANASTYTGSTTINSNVTLLIHVIDSDQNDIIGAQTAIKLLASPYTELMNEDTISGGLASASYNYTVDTDVVVSVRKSEDTDNPRYKAFSGLAVVNDSGLSLTISLIVQPLPI